MIEELKPFHQPSPSRYLMEDVDVCANCEEDWPCATAQLIAEVEAWRGLANQIEWVTVNKRFGVARVVIDGYALLLPDSPVVKYLEGDA